MLGKRDFRKFRLSFFSFSIHENILPVDRYKIKAMETQLFIESFLAEHHVGAYLSLDYENANPLLKSFTAGLMLTRKVAFLFKPKGSTIIAQALDYPFLRSDPRLSSFKIVSYPDWKGYLSLLSSSLSDVSTVLMDVSEAGLLPRVSLADYGSVDFVKGLGKEIVSSANLLNALIATIDERGEASQKRAAEKLLSIKDEAFMKIAESLGNGKECDEYAIQSFIGKRFAEEGLVYDDLPIVAVNANASNPHYQPTKERHSPIVEGDLILIDMWAKEKKPGSVYGDITWMAYAGKEVPDKMKVPFAVLVDAIDGALAFLETELPRREVEGYEVDRLVRERIGKSGFLPYFTHRTGHSIKDDASPHGPGVNMDDYESHDTRAIIDGNSFSLEPGIYLPEFGMRSETDVLIRNRKPIVVAGRQREIVTLLK